VLLKEANPDYNMAADGEMALRLGQRIMCDGHKAVVRFIGELDGRKGEWIGIEWEELDKPNAVEREDDEAGTPPDGKPKSVNNGRSIKCELELNCEFSGQGERMMAK
jgi:hypothetical protein